MSLSRLLDHGLLTLLLLGAARVALLPGLPSHLVLRSDPLRRPARTHTAVDIPARPGTRIRGRADGGVRVGASAGRSGRRSALDHPRALDTARLLDLGPVESLPALNSFFGRPDDRERTLDALRAFLASLPVDGQPVILVTHQVVVNAFTEATPPSGGGSIFQINGTQAPRWLGIIPIETREGS